jgi:hypothetical protein
MKRKRKEKEREKENGEMGVGLKRDMENDVILF